MQILTQKTTFISILVLFLSLSVFINITKAVDPPTGCGGTWLPSVSNKIRYTDWFLCYNDEACVGSVVGWTQISRINGSTGTCGPCGCVQCAPPGCVTATFVWDADVAPTCTLIASPSVLAILGQSSALSWTTTNIILPDPYNKNSATISNNIDVAIITATITPGNVTVIPTANTTYTMTVNNINGIPATCTATVSFPPPSCMITADPTGVYSGNTSTISWTITDATSGAINGVALTPAEIVAKSGSFTTPPITSSTPYNMTINGNGGPASCGPVIVGLLTPPTGGLVPCGRLVNQPPLPGETIDLIDESKPCDLCAAFYMLKNIINFVTELAVGIAVFILAIAGLLYVFSAGEPSKIELAKSAITYALTGLAIIFAAWLVIAIILQGLGYADINTWNQVNCNLQT